MSGICIRRAVPSLAVLAVGEDPDCEHTEGAADTVHRDRADRVVDLGLALPEPDGLDDDHTRDGADHRSSPRLHEGARRCDRDEAGEHAVGHHPRVGLAHAAHDPEHRDHGAEGSGDRGVRRHNCEPDVCHRERRGGVEPEPAEQQDERAEHGHRDVVRPECSRLPVPAVLADAGTEDDGARKSGGASHRVDHAGSREVGVAEAEVCALAQAREPAAAPRPRTEERVVDRAAEQAPADERVPLPALGHRPCRNRRRGVHEGDHVEEERHHTGGVRARAGQREVTLPEEHPVAASDERAPDRLVVSDGGPHRSAEHEGVSDEEEGHETQAEDREVRADDVGRVLGAAEARFDQREARLHEDDENGADHDPQQVDVDRGYRLWHRVLGERRGRSEQHCCAHHPRGR